MMSRQTEPDDSWPVEFTVTEDSAGRHRVRDADNAVVVCLDGELPHTPEPTDLTLAPLCAAKATGSGPNYLVCHGDGGF